MDIYERMKHVCGRIPQGKVATYGQIAMLCGKPNHARQVGYALRCQKAGKHIPAHRIVNAAGVLSGAGAFETYDTQKCLLEAEGVEVKKTDAGWKVDLKKYGWKNTLQEAEELYHFFEGISPVTIHGSGIR